MSAYLGFLAIVRRAFVWDDLILVLRVIVLVCQAPMTCLTVHYQAAN